MLAEYLGQLHRVRQLMRERGKQSTACFNRAVLVRIAHHDHASTCGLRDFKHPNQIWGSHHSGLVNNDHGVLVPPQCHSCVSSGLTLCALECSGDCGR